MISPQTSRLLPGLCFCLLLCIFLRPVNGQTDDTADRIQEIFDQGWALESRMHIDLANLDRAIALYEEAIALAPDNAEARWRLAEVTFKKSEETKDRQARKKLVERTITLAEQALKLNPRSVGGMYWAGTACARLADMSGIFSALKQVNKAKTYLQQAMETDSDHRLAVLAGVVLALIFAESPWPLRDLDRALELARWSAGKDPRLTIAALSLGKVYLARGENALAIKELERCLNIDDPTYPWDAVLYDRPEAEAILDRIRQSP